MEVLISFLTRRRSGSVSARSHETPCDVVRFGRGPDNEVQLPDPRISLYQAKLGMTASGPFFESQADVAVRIDGRDATSGPVRVGSTISMGPYEIKLVEPPSNIDLAVTVELVAPLGDKLDQLKARSQTSFEGLWVSRRRLSWMLAVPIFLLFFVWPVVGFFIDRNAPVEHLSPLDVGRTGKIWPIAGDLAWDTGELSGPHRFLARSCTTCHREPFQRVADNVCVACHQQVQHHVDPAKYDLPELTGVLCQACHKEHRGPSHIVRGDQQFCADCHSNLPKFASDTKLLNAGDFLSDHPQFKPTVPVDFKTGKRERLELDPNNWPKESSALKFSHKQHLDPGGMRVPDRETRKVLDCADCHKLETDGLGMKGISMEETCSSCHKLQFDPSRPDRTVPHGDPEVALRTIQEFYAAQGLTGGVPTATAPQVVRRRPGTPLSEAERKEVAAWAESEALTTASFVFERSVCSTCHVVNKVMEGRRPHWNVQAVVVPDTWMLTARFNHKRHESMACADCHDAKNSQTSSDVLLPGISNCQQCHAGEQASSKVPSTCVMCHDFHLPKLGPMRPEFVKSAIAHP